MICDAISNGRSARGPFVSTDNSWQAQTLVVSTEVAHAAHQIHQGFQGLRVAQQGTRTPCQDGQVFYLEVESGEREDRSSLIYKWENAFIAGGGRICVVAPRPGVMNTVQSTILNWATENGRKPGLYLTHLKALKLCNPGDSPWVRIR
jgi:hypothetical protein